MNWGLSRLSGLDISCLYTLYNLVISYLLASAIAFLLISPFIGAYIPLGTSIFAFYTAGVEYPGILYSIPLLIVGADHLKNQRWLVVTRVSTSKQADGPSLDQQGNEIKELMEEFDGTLVGEIEMEQTATTLDQEKFNQILEKARNDEFDVLGISQLDRLTRADPWEAMDFMRTLYQNGVILCTASDGPYDWDDPDDFDKITTEIVLAHKHIVKIKDGQKRGYRSSLQEKRWIQNRMPPTFIKLDDDRYMSCKDGAQKVANALYNKYIQTENMRETERYVNNELLPVGEIEHLSYSQIRSNLGDRQLLGKFPSNGEVLAEHEEFKLVSEEQMQQVIELRESNSNTKKDNDPMESLDALTNHAERFGPMYTLVNILTKFRPICECGEQLKWDGDKTGESMGVTVPKFECHSCGETVKIPSKKEMQAMHQVLPLRCPYCIQTDEFEATKLREVGTYFDYKYKCSLCEEEWGSNKCPDEIRRALNHPELKFSINDNSVSPEEIEQSEDHNLEKFI